MPPRPKLRKEDILEAAFAHVRQNGWQGLTARHLAEQLNTSTKPIYFHFPSMGAIEAQIVKKTMEMILTYMMVPRTDDPWIDHAVGVIMFALEEKHLFRAVFDEKHVETRRKYSVHVWKTGQAKLSDYPPFTDLSDIQIETIRRARWLFVHGFASLMNISNWPWQKANEPLLIRMIERISRAVYNEFRDDPDMLLYGEHFQQPSELPGRKTDENRNAEPNRRKGGPDPSD